MKDLKIQCKNVTHDQALVYARRALSAGNKPEITFGSGVTVKYKETKTFDVYEVAASCAPEVDPPAPPDETPEQAPEPDASDDE